MIGARGKVKPQVYVLELKHLYSKGLLRISDFGFCVILETFPVPIWRQGNYVRQYVVKTERADNNSSGAESTGPKICDGFSCVLTGSLA